MAIALTPTVTAYRITPSSPTGELLTLARIYDEVGDYASTILDSAHRALTRLCRRRSAAVTRELRRRGILTGEATLPSPLAAPAVPAAQTAPSSLITMTSDLTQMSISELYQHYLAWPQRHEALIATGHEPLDFSYEARIIRELQRRTAATLDEQLKKDYCLLTYRTELLNLSRIHSLPVDELHSEECILSSTCCP